MAGDGAESKAFECNICIEQAKVSQSLILDTILLSLQHCLVAYSKLLVMRSRPEPTLPSSIIGCCSDRGLYVKARGCAGSCCDFVRTPLLLAMSIQVSTCAQKN